MQLRIRLFAGTREVVGTGSLDVDLPEGARIVDAMDALCAKHPRLAAYRSHALYALDGAFVPTTTPLRSGAELAIMPPVSGGMGALQEGPFSLDALVAELEKRGAGAVVGFVGYVRGDEGVARLRFEAYEPMAEREIAAICDEARAKFEIADVIVRHRVATLAVGEPIVAVVVAAPHRRAAFEAAMWAMDELKTRVPVWKAEEGPTGARWVNDPTQER